MAWYWWMLIAAGVILLGAVKLYLWDKLTKKKAESAVKKEDED